jgi:hypothetical protein
MEKGDLKVFQEWGLMIPLHQSPKSWDDTGVCHHTWLPVIALFVKIVICLF